MWGSSGASTRVRNLSGMGNTIVMALAATAIGCIIGLVCGIIDIRIEA